MYKDINEKNQQQILHPVFDRIILDKEEKKVLEIPEIAKLRYKTQLGVSYLSDEYPNAKHTRYLHSLGVYSLMKNLIEILNKKHPYLKISKKEQQILCISGLLHDAGHLPFSHTLESMIDMSHEERTIKILKENSEIINNIYRFDIVSETIEFLEICNQIKEGNKKITGKLDVFKVFYTLLAGDIDVDKIEYLMTDSCLTLGYRKDFTQIFDGINFVVKNNEAIVVFEESVIPKIIDLLMLRIEMYAKVYFSPETIYREISLARYLKMNNYAESDIISTTEAQILSKLEEEISSKVSINSRLAKRVFKSIALENVYFKSFEDKKEYDIFLNKLNGIISSDEYIDTIIKKRNGYNPEKNKILVLMNDGTVKELSQTMYGRINLETCTKYYVFCDLNEEYQIAVEEKEKIHKLFTNNPVEIEDKFIPKYKISSEEILQKLFESPYNLETISLPASEINKDTYYANELIPDNIAFRKRCTKNGTCFFIKAPIKDGTDQNKRKEHEFPKISFEEFSEVAKEFLKTNTNIVLPKDFELKEELKITTNRVKTLINVEGIKIEIAVDSSKYIKNGKISTGEMIELELKDSQDQIILHLISTYLETNFDIERTYDSKLKRARKALENC